MVLLKVVWVRFLLFANKTPDQYTPESRRSKPLWNCLPSPSTPANWHCHALAQAGSSALVTPPASVHLGNIYFFTLQLKYHLLWKSHHPPEHGHSLPHSLHVISVITVQMSWVSTYPLSLASSVPTGLTSNRQRPNFLARLLPRLLNLLRPPMGQARKCLGINAQTPHPWGAQPMTDKSCCLKTSGPSLGWGWPRYVFCTGSQRSQLLLLRQ